MKKLLIILLFSGTVFSEWHSWETLPKEGQMIMIVDLFACVHYTKRQILIISHYHSSDHIYQYYSPDGWWDVKPQDILQWFEEGSKILYLPSEIDENFIERMKKYIQ